MSFNSSRDTLLVQLSVIGESVSQLRSELVELGGALIEAEQRRLTGKLRAIEARHAELLEALRSDRSDH
jgi:hypothetical protein